MSTLRYRRGSIQTNQPDSIWLPRALRFGALTPALILAHGAGSADVDDPGWGTVSKLIHRMTEEGFPCVSGFMGGDTYANDAISGSAGTSYMNKALDYAVASTGCAPKAHTFGLSMGAGVSIRWASLNPAKAKSVVGTIPMTNINYLYENASVGGVDFRPAIGTAWGVTSPTPLPAGANLQTTAAGLLLTNGIPSRMEYTSDDPYVRVSDVATFAANAGGTTVNLGTGGHLPAGVVKGEVVGGGTNWDALVAWYVDKGPA